MHNALRRAFGDIRAGNPYWRQSLVTALFALAYWQLWQDSPFGWWSIDGYPTLVAGKLLLAGKGSSAYQPDLWLSGLGNPDWRQALIDLRIMPAKTSFVYHPVYLWVTAPIVAWMDFDSFAWFLLVFNALATGLVATEIGFFVADLSPSLRKLLMVSVALSFPALYAAFLGQNIVPAMLCVLVGRRWLAVGRIWQGALLLTLAVAMKVWLLPLTLLAGVLHGRRAFAWVAGASVVLLVLVPVGLAPELTARYLQVAQRLTEITVFPYNNVSLRAFFARLIDAGWVYDSHIWRARVVPPEVRTLEYVAWTWCALVVSAVWLRFRPQPIRMFAAGCGLILLLPGVCWTHYYFLALVPLAMLAVDKASWRAWTGWAGIAVCAVPWHNLPMQVRKWPSQSAIAADPGFALALLGIPNLIMLVIAVLVLAGRERLGERLPLHAGAGQRT